MRVLRNERATSYLLSDRRRVGREVSHLLGGSFERVILFYKSEIVDKISVLEPVHIALVDLLTRYAWVRGWSCANSYDAWIAPKVATAFGERISAPYAWFHYQPER